ncbi:MAG: hypothetical protein NXI32_04880 [bacterium]|nr:hypothetical protein [bacterium]
MSTTFETIEKFVATTKSIREGRREQLIAKLRDGTSTPNEIGGYANGVYKADGEWQVWVLAQQAVDLGREFHASDEQIVGDIKAMAQNIMLSGADDTWSGRCNDVKRCVHDGKLDAIRQLMDLLKRHKSA